MKLLELERQREALQHQIMQDRLDIVHASQQWREASQPFDRAWLKVARYKGVALTMISLGTAWKARRNRKQSPKNKKGLAGVMRKVMLGYTLYNRGKGLIKR
ncbi:YqjK family protein [Larsenimonas salina]|uniref:YqjK family protein n=1 Tax=Larsenimonas salina TaxID=1295565 RepID=UPI0020740145|nr:YqjK-like family protein [Larsenimonas salina]